MIDEALEFVRREVQIHLGVSDSEASLESPRVFTGEGSAEGMTITLINAEEEPALRNTPSQFIEGGQPVFRRPSVYMNLYLLFAFNFQTYSASLFNLSRVVELFQHRRIFTAADTSAQNAWPDGVERLAFDHHNMSFEALNNLWSIMGGALFPCVVYKMRLVELRLAAGPDPQVPIDTIALDISNQ